VIDTTKFWNPDYTDFAVHDVETTINAPDGFKFAADPRYTGNKIVVGAHTRDGVHVGFYDQQSLDKGTKIARSGTVIVGHNFKFDAQYLGFNPNLCWDTGIAHYILSGQKEKMPSLEKVAAHYGLGHKTVPMSELWEIGFKTEDMDPEFLREYVAGDVKLTREVYLKQLEATEKTPWTRLLITHCSMAGNALGDAEMTGLPINVAAMQALHDREVASARAFTAANNTMVCARYGFPAGTVLPLTPKNLGLVLHGLPITLEERRPSGRILKSGKVSKRIEVVRTEYTTTYKPILPIVRTGSGAIKVDDDVLQAHADAGSPIAKNMQLIRTSEKLTSTYTGPALEYMKATGFHAIHTKFNQTVTNTGRTSSTGPNVQNLPPEIELCVRAPKDKYLVKADFSQLQICGLAMVTGDEQLIEDVNSNTDIHYETGKSVYRWTKPEDMKKDTRRVVKNVNFGLIFGGTAKGLSKQTGVEVGTIQLLINSFKKRYPKAYAFGTELAKKMEEQATPSEGEFIDGVQVREAFSMTPSGRLLRFVERTAPAWLAAKTKRPLSFSPNEIANYPIQGYTDGDLAIQFLALMYWNGIRIINLVHDAYWFLTDDPVGLKIQVSALLDHFNEALKLKVPLKLDFAVEDSDGKKVGHS